MRSNSKGAARLRGRTARGKRKSSRSRRSVLQTLETRTMLIGTPPGQLVDALYQDILHRAAEPAGLTAWSQTIAANVPHDQVAREFLNSIEHRSQVVSEYYRSVLGRAPDDSGLKYWVGTLGTGDRLEHVLASLLASSEYFVRQGSDVTGFVQGVYRDVLDRSGDPSGIEYWSKVAKTAGRDEVASSFVTSPEYRGHLAASWYETYLRRKADDAGRDYWAGQLARGASQEFVQSQFAGSPEYFASATFAGVLTPGPSGTNTATKIKFGGSTKFQDEMGMYPVDDRAGHIGNLAPGAPGYVQAALTRAGRQVIIHQGDIPPTFDRAPATLDRETTLNLPGATYFGLYLIQDASAEQLLRDNPTNARAANPKGFFSSVTANPDDFDHVHYQAFNRFSFEDLTGGGDKDFNDTVAEIQFVLDTSALIAPDFDLAPAFDSAPVGDHRTSFDPVTLVGQTSPNVQLRLEETGATTTSDAAGQFEFTNVALVMGDNPFTVTATNAAGATATSRRSIVFETCDFDSQLTGWNVDERGGVAPGKGTVVSSNGSAILTEGNSFAVAFSKTFVVPSFPSRLSFQYSDLNFDESSTGLIKDAFEAAFVDDQGRPLTPTFTPGRDAFFNITEGMPVAGGAGVSTSGKTVSVDLSGVPSGTVGRLILRLVNNDADTRTSVSICTARVEKTVLDITASKASSLSPSSLRSIASPTLASPPNGLGANSKSVILSSQTGAGQDTLSASTSSAKALSGTTSRVLSAAVSDVSAVPEPVINELGATPKWAVTTFATAPDSNQVMMTPAVIDLNGDKIPDVVFSTFSGENYNNGGVLRAISGDDGHELWSITDANYRVAGRAGVAVGDIDHDGQPEIIAEHESDRLIAFEANGKFKWLSPPITGGVSWGSASLADLDQDGTPEIVVGATVLSADGSIRWEGKQGRGYALSSVADIDLDGRPEVVAGNTVYRNDGDILWKAPIPDGFTAIGNFNSDAFAEIVVVAAGSVYLVDHLGALIWGPVSMPGGGFGGAPTIADFDNDGKPEIGVAGASQYAVFEDDGTILWQNTVQDFSSSVTGSSVYDFEGDGSAEVIYGDERFLWVYRGSDGHVLYQLPKGSGTTSEMPLVVDVDGDGQTDIVAIANDYSGGVGHGIYAIQSANDSWVPTRAIWNQHTYHITNVNDDGTIPTHELNSWQIYNNYRRNRQPTGTQIGPPTISASAPNEAVAVGTTVILSGLAQADFGRSGRERNSIVMVTVNGVPVDSLDAAGDFFTRVEIQPGRNMFDFVATDEAGQTARTAVTIMGEQPEQGEIDFRRFADISASFSGVYGRTSFRDDGRVLYTDLATRNDGQFVAEVPLLVGVKNISDPSVRVVGASGTTPDGVPFFDFTDWVGGGRLSPGERTSSPSIGFFDPTKVQFRYELVFYGRLNEAPIFTTVPPVAADSGREYRYDADATDEDHDALTFSLVTSPAGMAIDAASGIVTWSPTAEQVGTTPVAVRVSDGRGGVAEQRFTLTISVPPPNRPPVITSTPVVYATATELTPYRYDAEATDPDRDSLVFRVVSGPDGLKVNPTTGEVIWAPAIDQIGTHSVKLEVSDGRGGVATQEYQICVPSDPSNHPPVIVSQPVTGFALNASALPSGGSIFLTGHDPDWHIPGNNGTGARNLIQRGVAYVNDPVFNSFAAAGVHKFLLVQSTPATIPNGFADGRTAMVASGFAEGIDFDTSSAVNLAAALDQLGRQYSAIVIVSDYGGLLTQDELDVLNRRSKDIISFINSGGGLYAMAESNEANTTPHGGQYGFLPFVVSSRLVDQLEVGNALTDFGATLGLSVSDVNGNASHVVFDGMFGLNVVDRDSQSRILSLAGRGEVTRGGVFENVYKYQADAVDSDNDSLTYELVQGPVGATIDRNSGLIQWPVVGVGGQTTLTFDGSGLTPGFGPPPFDRGIPLGTSPISTQFASQGVEFSIDSDGLDWISAPSFVGGDAGPSGGSVFAINSIDAKRPTTLSATFRDPATGNPGVVDGGTFSVFVSDTNASPDPRAIVRTIGLDGQVIEERSLHVQGELLRFSKGHVARVEFFDAGGDGHTIDDFSFGPITPIDVPVTVRVEDGRGGSDEQSFTIHVATAGGEIRGIVRDTATEIVVASSRFDQDLDGWTSTAPQNIEWRSSGGNPSGQLYFHDRTYTDPLVTAPAQYLGDWSRLNESGSIQYDQTVTFDGDKGGAFEFISHKIFISGPGGSAAWVGATPTALTPWETITAPLNARQWTLSRGTWLELLQNVTSFQIQVELVSNHDGGFDESGLDNVRLVDGAGVGLPGWTVYLDHNQNGRRDAGEISTTTEDGASITVYSDDFENPTDPLSAWSKKVSDTTPQGARRFLGQFSAEKTTLSLRDLPEHTDATISFDLFVIRSWDGNVVGPDEFKVSVVGGNTLLDSTFSNVDGLGGFPNWEQSYPDAIGSGSHPAHFGAAETNTLGYVFSFFSNSAPWSSVYHFSYKFAHDSDDLAIDFAAFNLEGIDNESWGLDNVAVDVTAAPGSYSFKELPPGSYSVREELQPGWTQTAPPSGAHVVTISGSETVAGIDFGNHQTGDISNRNPSITSTGPDVATSGQLLRYDLVASDPDGDSLAFDLPTAPAGMTIHPTLGTLVWTPTQGQIGSVPVVIRVQDGNGGLAIQSFQLTVSAANSAPVITSVPPGPATVGLPYEYRVVAQDADGDPIMFSLEAPAPAGLSIDPSTGVLTGAFAAAGTLRVVVLATDSPNNGVTRQPFDLIVEATTTNFPPDVSFDPRLTATVGLPYVAMASATDASGDPISFALETSPAGMTIDDAGLITWTPSSLQAGVHHARLKVSDGRGGDVFRDFDVTVESQAVNHAPIVVSTPKSRAVADRLYSLDLQGFDEDHDQFLWTLLSGPRGMSLNPFTGALRWTPDHDQLGVSEVVVRIADPRGASTRQSFSIDVSCNNLAPAILSAPPTEGALGAVYLYPVRANDPEGDPLTFSLLSSPRGGMSLDSATGLLRWTPVAGDAGASVRVAIQVSDGQGNAATQTFSIEVSAAVPNQPPVINSRPTFVATVGQEYAYDVVAFDPEHGALAYSLGASPVAMTIDPASGAIRWTPAAQESGAHLVTIEVRDPVGGLATQSFSVLAQANLPPTIISTAPITVAAADTYRYDARATDPNNDTLSYRLANSPAGMSIDDFGRIRWRSPAVPPAGKTPVTIVVSDPFGLSATQSFEITVRPDVIAPAVRLTTSATLIDQDGRFVVDANAEVRFSVLASDNVAIASVRLLLDGAPLALDSSGVAATVLKKPGVIHAVARATDAAGNTSEAAIDLRVRDPNDSNAPAVAITSPDQSRVDNVVTYLTNVVGSVSDANLLGWRLEYALASAVDLNDLAATDPDWVRISAGTTNVNGVLGVFDPTLLPNDSYVLRLYAEDTGGLINTRGVIVGVQGAAKLGNFHLEFTDLSVPLAGFPITIKRVYDTLQANQEGDFGFGWKLGLADPDIRETVSPDNSFRIGTRVYLTDPDGRRIGFKFDPVPQATWFGTLWRPRFTPDPGVLSTLTVPDDGLSLFPDGQFGGFLFGFQYNPSQYTLTRPDGAKYEYEQTIGLRKVTDRNGNTLTFTPDAIEHSSGERIALHRDGRGRITEIVDPQGNSLKYSYSAAGDLISFTDQVNNRTTFSYLSNHAHFLDEIHDPLGRRASKTIYGPDGRIQKVIDALGAETLLDFDPSHFKGTITDAKGAVTLLEYDSRGNVVKETDALGHVTTREYGDPQNPDKETKVVDKNGAVTTFDYDSRGNILTISDTFGSRSFAYNELSKVTRATDENGNTTSFGYDKSGNTSLVTNASGDVSKIVYDESARPKSYTDYRGITTAFVYQGNSTQPAEIHNPDDSASNPSFKRIEYNDFGQTTRSTDEDGHILEQRFDAAGRLTYERLGNDAPVEHHYSGKLETERVIRRSLVELGRTDLVTQLGYWTTDQLRYEIDAIGAVTGYEYDANGARTFLGRWNSKSDYDADYAAKALTPTTVFAGRFPRATLEHVFVYDVLGRLDYELDDVQLALAEKAGISLDQISVKLDYDYDASGNRRQIIDRNGRVRHFEYDARNRLTQEQWFADVHDTTPDRSFVWTYGASGAVEEATEFAAEPNTSAVLSHYVYTHDEQRRVTSVDNIGTLDMPHVVLSYEFDSSGNRVSVSDNLGVAVKSTYDSRNRVDRRWWENTTVTHAVDEVLVDFDYYANGAEKELRRYSDKDATKFVGRTLQGNLDAAGRIGTISHRDAADQVLAEYDYTFDRLGLVDGLTYNNTNDRFDFSVDYRYDDVGQLTVADYTDATIGHGIYTDEFYRYDKNGNRVDSYLHPRAAQADGTSYETGAGNRLLSDGDFDYAYDNEGNMVRKSERATGHVTVFEYDHRNLMSRATTYSKAPESGGVILSESTNRYDVGGGRIEFTSDDDGVGGHPVAVVRTINDGANVWADFQANGAVTAHYLLGDRLDQLVAKSTPTGAEPNSIWYLADAWGTIRDDLTPSGGERSHSAYGSFGTLLVAAPGERFSFTGRESDSLGDTYFFRARSLDTSIGRFTTNDPLGFEGADPNLYRYALNQPTSRTDPTGTFSIGEYAVTVGVTVAVVRTFLHIVVDGNTTQEALAKGLKGGITAGILAYFLAPAYALEFIGVIGAVAVGGQKAAQQYFVNLILEDLKRRGYGHFGRSLAEQIANLIGGLNYVP